MYIDDIAVKNTSHPFSKAFQSSHSHRQKYCPLCSKAGIESLVNDENICSFCGDVGIKHGISKDDDLFVVNSVGGGAGDDSDSNNNGLAFGTFGGFESLDSRRPTQQQKSLQQALKETEIC